MRTVVTVLPDILKPNLKVVFCGTAVGTRSAEVGACYAGSGNQFWDVLWRTHLTRGERLKPEDFPRLPEFGIGLTDLVKVRSGPDNSINTSDYDVAGFLSKIKQFTPKILAFNGKRAACAFYGRKRVDYGRQSEPLGRTAVFVLPSTSGAARRYWKESHWRGLAKCASGS